jgi:hypothetical protein
MRRSLVFLIAILGVSVGVAPSSDAAHPEYFDVTGHATGTMRPASLNPLPVRDFSGTFTMPGFIDGAATFTARGSGTCFDFAADITGVMPHNEGTTIVHARIQPDDPIVNLCLPGKRTFHGTLVLAGGTGRWAGSAGNTQVTGMIEGNGPLSEEVFELTFKGPLICYHSNHNAG